MEDLVGQLIIGLAPHTSGGVLGRIIGWSDTSGGYAHPLFHAAKRRNCDGDEDCIMLLMDGLLNFSRQLLPNRRGINGCAFSSNNAIKPFSKSIKRH